MSDAGRIYVEAIIERYLWLPGTPSRTSRSDRRLAGSLYERGIPLAIVQMALLLGASRRVFRSENAPPLPPIRTLHYFLPVVDELLEQPVAPGYAEYLESKLLPLADVKDGGARGGVGANEIVAVPGEVSPSHSLGSLPARSGDRRPLPGSSSPNGIPSAPAGVLV